MVYYLGIDGILSENVDITRKKNLQRNKSKTKINENITAL